MFNKDRLSDHEILPQSNVSADVVLIKPHNPDAEMTAVWVLHTGTFFGVNTLAPFAHYLFTESWHDTLSFRYLSFSL